MASAEEFFTTDDIGESDGYLITPELDDEAMAAIAAADRNTDHPDEAPTTDTTDGNNVQRGTPGDTVECNICAKRVRVRKDGFLSVHKCDPKPERGTRLASLPERKSPIKSRTRDFTVGILAWSVEEATAQLLARPFGVDPDDVPTELPDADVMVGAPLDMVWPELPDGAKRFLDKLADNSDILECGMAWFEWVRTLGQWTRQQRAYQQQIAEVNRDGAAESSAGNRFGQLVPFVPAEQS